MSLSRVSPVRAAQRMSWFLLFLIGVALTISLYFVKTHAQSAKRDVRELSKAISGEEAAVRVLRAELAYLRSPARLSELNAAHLGLDAILPEQESSDAQVEGLFPIVEVAADD